MREKNRFRPSLESLEDRWCPATVKLINGILFVSNQQGTLEITAKAGNKLNVVDNVTDVTLEAPTMLLVTGTSGGDKIHIDIDAVTYSGNILVNAVGGSDLVRVFGDGGTASGDITILTGDGSDTVRINRGSTSGDLTIGGNVTLVNSTGKDIAQFGNPDDVTTYGGDIQVVGFARAFLSKGSDDVMQGSVNITTVNGQELRVTHQPGLRIAGNLTITSGAANDKVTLKFEDVGGQPGLGGNVTINLGSGNNLLKFAPAAALTLDGNLTYTVGGGNDSITLDPDLTVEANVTLNMGDGNNDYDGLDNGFIVSGDMRIYAGAGTDDLAGFEGDIGGDVVVSLGDGTNEFTPSGSVEFLGNLSYTGGNGKNTVDLDSNPVNGNLTYRVGNGNGNDFDIDEPVTGTVSITTGNGSGNVATFDDGATVGKLIYRGGNGGDRLQIFSDDGLFDLDLEFGSGDDTLQFGGVAASVTGFVDGDGGTNLLQGAGNVTFVPPFTILNFV